MKTVSGARVAVAGAGAIGLATGLVLARAGLAVTVFDPGALGDNASGVAAGMLAPVSEALFDEASSPHLALLRRARDLWPAFVEGLDIEILRHGVRVEGPEGWLADIAARAEGLGVAVEGRPIVVDEDWRLDARATLQALRSAAEALGVSFEASHVEDFRDGWLTSSDGRFLAFDALVVATGAADREGALAPETRWLAPIKGQILRLDSDEPDGPVLRGPGVYLAPSSQSAVGATMEVGQDDRSPDLAKIEPLREALATLRPELSTTDARIEVGVRASTPDGLPLVGWSAKPGVMLAVGARRNGWLLAPLVAGVVAAYLTEKDPGPDAARLDARRFDREPEA